MSTLSIVRMKIEMNSDAHSTQFLPVLFCFVFRTLAYAVLIPGGPSCLS